MASSLAKKLKANKSKSTTKKSKVKTYDTTGDDSPPWDEDISSVEVEAANLGVRMHASSEDEDDIFDDEEAAKYKKGLRRVSKKVSNKSRPYNSPATQEMVTRLALASVLRQLPIAERHYTASGSERSAYAYSNLINQARELMSDLRSQTSSDALAEAVVMEAVRPAFLQMVNFIIGEISTIRSKLNSGGSIDSLRRTVNEQLTRMLEEIGSYGQETLDKASDSTRKALKG